MPEWSGRAEWTSGRVAHDMMRSPRVAFGVVPTGHDVRTAFTIRCQTRDQGTLDCRVASRMRRGR